MAIRSVEEALRRKAEFERLEEHRRVEEGEKARGQALEEKLLRKRKRQSPPGTKKVRTRERS